MVRLAVAAEVVERTIGSLRGVQGVKVVQSALGEVDEIHVLIDAERSPKQTVRDVESVLLTTLDLPVDHRKISVAQLNMAPAAGKGKSRLKFVEAGVSMKRNCMQAVVGLERDGQTYTATVEGVYSGMQQQARLVAEATVGAIQQAGAGDVSLGVDDVARLSLGGKDLVVVVIKEVVDGTEASYSGSAVCKQDVIRAAVNATLSALNRRTVRGA